MQKLRKLFPNDFPPLLREIPDAPSHLYIEGELPDPSLYKYLAVVGSRKYSKYGEEAAQKLISGLSGKPIVIVSGLALGMDAIAHQAALNAGLRTVAIPGSGLSKEALYPVTNRPLAQKILEAGGALLSEFEPEWRPRPESFLKRNRIVAGISHASLIVEAAERSGALSTARLALDYNREVLTVPGSIFSLNSAGPHRLIRNGATPVSRSVHILEALGFETTAPASALSFEIENCSREEKEILELLHEPLSRDELVASSDLPTQTINRLISMLEIKGLLKEEAGEIHRA